MRRSTFSHSWLNALQDQCNAVIWKGSHCAVHNLAENLFWSCCYAAHLHCHRFPVCRDLALLDRQLNRILHCDWTEWDTKLCSGDSVCRSPLSWDTSHHRGAGRLFTVLHSSWHCFAEIFLHWGWVGTLGGTNTQFSHFSQAALVSFAQASSTAASW